jgi:RNA polymerase sigma factor (sigma-70 family)
MNSLTIPTPDTLLPLIQQAQRGDLRAFDEIVRRFQDGAVGYGVAVLGDFHGAEDVAQEAFLEAYRTLPDLRYPAAFAGWLRLLVRKHCDRRTRRRTVPTVPLDQALWVALPFDVAEELAAQEMRETVRASIRELPEAERTVIVMFYLGQRSLKEIAAFLEVPVTTVKNRLHTARRRLKERMVQTVEETLQEKRPSKDSRFRDRVFAALYQEYWRQRRENPLTADPNLLQEARADLHRFAEAGIVDTETAHTGCNLFSDLADYASLTSLMDRYLAQPLPPAEEVWARWQRVRSLAATQKHAEAVEAQRSFLPWAQEMFARHTIRLTDHDHFWPVRDSEPAMPQESLPVWSIGIAEIAISFKEEGLSDEWITLTQNILDSVPKTRANRVRRFYQLRTIVSVYAWEGRIAEAQKALDPIRALTNEEKDWEAPRWTIEALYMTEYLYSNAKDPVAVGEAGAEATRLLADYAAQIDKEVPEQVSMLRSLSHNVASPLTANGHYAIALPLWEHVTAEGRATQWAYLWHAASLWGAKQDKEGTLTLLRQATARHPQGGMVSFFREHPAFAAVKYDPDFLAAVTSPEPPEKALK